MSFLNSRAKIDMIINIGFSKTIKGKKQSLRPLRKQTQA